MNVHSDNQMMSEAQIWELRVRDAFQKYVDSKREFLPILAKCAFKGWPDRKPALQIMVRLQVLLNEVEALRFEYVMIRTPSWVEWTSLATISARLLDGWTDAEEGALKQANPLYDDRAKEIDRCRAELDSDAIDEPLRAVQRDPEYLEARLALRATLHNLDEQLLRKP